MAGARGRAEDGRRAVLHLGMPKAGSTSIQEVFGGYRDERIEYARLGLRNHSLVLQRCFLEGKRARRAFPQDSAERRDRQREAALRRLEAVLGGTGRSVILSGENLFGFDAEGCRRCVAFLRRHVGRVDALLYVRPPASYARSVFQERLKGGRARFDIRGIVPRYQRQATAWAEALGGEEPAYALFDRSGLRDGDVVTDFAWRLGLDPAWTEAHRHLQNRNASLSAEATAALYLLRHARGALSGSTLERMRQQRLIEALRDFGRRRFDFGRELLDEALAERAEEIAWMEARLGRRFPAEEVRDAVVFGSEGDILGFAEAQAPALGEHLRARGLIGRRAGQSTVELLEAAARRPIGLSDLRREARLRGWHWGPVLPRAGRAVGA